MGHTMEKGHWTREFEKNKNGDIIPNRHNTGLVLKNDERFKGLWAKNMLTGRVMQTRDLISGIVGIPNLILKDRKNFDVWGEEGDKIVAAIIAHSRTV